MKLGLEQAGVKITERGIIEIDKQCRTNVSNIYAIGDIVPGPQLHIKHPMKQKLLLKPLQDIHLKLII